MACAIEDGAVSCPISGPRSGLGPGPIAAATGAPLRAPGPAQPPADHGRLAADLAAWSAAAGHTTTTERIEASLRKQSGVLQDRYRAMIDTLGLGAGVAVERLYWAADRILTAWRLGLVARYDIPTPWNGRSRASPRAAALVAFSEFRDAAEFDPAITEADLVARADQALAVGRRRGRKARREQPRNS
jgi:hypothetical protein